MKQIGSITLETERLLLRAFQATDAKDMYQNWANNKNVTKFLTWPTHESIEVSQKLVDLWAEESKDLSTYQWAIELKESHQVIGSIGVVRMEENIDAVEIGYCIGEKYWGKGITTEAFQKLIMFLFEEVECNRIAARHDVNNPGSGKVMLKAGLQYEGTLLEAGKNNLGICDMAVYGITKRMYLAHTDKI